MGPAQLDSKSPTATKAAVDAKASGVDSGVESLSAARIARILFGSDGSRAPPVSQRQNPRTRTARAEPKTLTPSTPPTY
jgi:hypothetical protein